MKNRVLAIVLCLGLLLSMIPMSAIAVSTEPEVASHTSHEGWTAWGDDENEADTLPSVSGQYYLVGDIALTQAAGVASAEEIVLCLHGNTVDCTESKRAYRLCKGAQLTICDCSAATDESGTYTAGRIMGATNTAIMIGAETPGATLNICDGIFTDNNISGSGGVIVAQGGSTVNIYNGEFSDNSATKNAGAIYANTATVNLYGGTLKGNHAGSAGAALYVTSANANLEGGLITENESGHGAGLFVQNASNIVLNGVTICNNTATYRGAGVDYTGSGTLKVGGTTCITGNKLNEKENNLVLVNGRKLQLDETMPLTQGAQVGISVCTWTDATNHSYDLNGTVQFGTNATQEDAAQYFTSDFTGTEHTVQVKNGSLRFALPKKDHPVEGYHGDEQWTEWTSANSLPATSGYYYLAGDVNVTTTNGVAVNSEQNIVLCLNGYTITGQTRIYRLSKGANVTICDCTACYNADNEFVSGKLIPGTAEGGVATLVADGATVETTLNLQDITIDGSTKSSSNGNALCLGYAGAIVNIDSCVIRNCTSTSKGGAIYNHSGTLTVTDSLFTGNTANYGGALFLQNSSKTTLINTTITDNVAKVYGGGIDNELSTTGTGFLKLEGDTVIQNNRNNKTGQISNINLLNGSRRVVIGQLGENALIGVVAEKNTDSSDLGAVTVAETATEADVAHFVSDRNHDVILDGGKLKIQPRVHTDHATDECGHGSVAWTATNVLPTAAGHYYLTGNVSVSSTVGIAYNSGAEVTICLNGYDIVGTGSGRLFRVSNGTKLSICDCTGHGKLTGGNNATGGVAWLGKDASDTQGGILNLYGGIVTGNTTGAASALIAIPNGTFNMYGGEISGNDYRAVILNSGAFHMSGGKISNNVYGGQDGVVLRMTGGTFTMTGGEISGNENPNNGATIRIDKGTAELTDGKICGNTAKSAAGLMVTGGTVTLAGVEVSGNTTGGNGGGLYVMGTAQVNVNAGTVITDNTANGTGGAGIYMTGTPEVVVDGAVITNNTAGKSGGGIYHAGTGTLKVGGATQITGNTAGGVTSNLHLLNGSTFVLQNLSEGASIGLRAELSLLDDKGMLLVGTNAVQEGAEAYFTSDQNKLVGRDNNGLYVIQKLAEHKPHTSDECSHESVSWKYWGDNTTLPTAEGHYYLVDDVTLGATTGVAYNNGAEVTICLNGFTISGAGTGRVFRLSNGTTVHLCDCTGSGKITNTNNAKAGIAWIGQDAGDSAPGALNIYGGTFTGCNVGNDGALVYVDGGSFNLYGGTFTGNDCRILYLNKGTMGIHGGTITNNTFGRRDGLVLRMSDGEFTMTGGEISGNDNGSSSGMIRVDNGTANFTGGSLTNNAASGGAAIVLTGGKSLMKGVSVTNNKAKMSGGGIYIMNGAELTISSGTVISGNRSGKWGGGIYVSDSKLTINGGSISGNHSGTEGGGLYASNSTVTISGGSISYNTTDSNGAGICNRGDKGVLYLYGGTISNNKALNTKPGTGHCGGILIQGKGSLYVYGGNITDNACNSQGGGIRVGANSGFGLYGGKISGNTAYRGAGVYSESDFTMENCVITSNTAANEGGGMYISDCKLTINSGTISNNAIADKNDDGIPDGSSGGLTVRLNAQCIMNGGEIIGNVGKHAGGVVVQSQGVFTLNDGLIAENTAQGGYGGGLYNSRATVNLLGGTFRDNVSTHAGGALYTDGTFLADGCEFVGNSVTASSGGICSGGAIKIGQKASATLKNCTFTENMVMGRGGALDVSYKGSAVIDGCTFTANTASANGGAIGVYTVAQLDVTDSVFKGNNAVGTGGAIYSESTSVMNFTDTTFEGNQSISGGAVYVGIITQANFNNCTLTGNTGNRFGSAIYANGGISLTDTTINGGQGKAHAVTLDASGSDGESFLVGINQFKGNVIIADNAGGGLELLEGAWISIHGDGLSDQAEILVTQPQGGITKQIVGAYDYVRQGDVYTLTKGELALSQADPITVTEEEEEVPTTEEPETPEEVPGNAKTVVLAVFGGLIAVSAVLIVIAVLAVKKKKNAKK